MIREASCYSDEACQAPTLPEHLVLVQNGSRAYKSRLQRSCHTIHLTARPISYAFAV